MLRYLFYKDTSTFGGVLSLVTKKNIELKKMLHNNFNVYGIEVTFINIQYLF